jgi:hypothetical protein
MSEIAIVMTSEEAQAWAGIQRLTRGTKDLEKGMADVGKATAAAAKEQKDLERAAAKVFEATRTPLERYKKDMADLSNLLQKGKIDQETYGRAAAKAAEDMKKAGEAAKSSFGGQALANLASFAKEMIGISGASAAVMGTLQKMSEIKDEAARKAREAEMPLGELAQLAIDDKGGVDKAKYQALVKGARDLYAQGGAPTLGAAAKTVFSLESAGISGERQFFGDMVGSGMFTEAGPMAKAIATLTNSMGTKETGSARQLVSKALGAAQLSPGTAERLLEAAARSGTGAAALGISDEEVLASTSVLSQSIGSEEMAGTGLASLFKSLRKMGSGETGGGDETGAQQTLDAMFGAQPGGKGGKKKQVGFDFKGKSLDEMVQQIEEVRTREGLSDADMMKIFGRQEAFKAWELLKGNRAKVGAALTATRGAGETDLAGQLMALPGENIGQFAAQQARKQGAARENALDPAGTIENLWQASNAVYERETAEKHGPDSWTLGISRMRDATFGKIPGAKERDLKRAVREGMLDRDAELKHRIVGHFGATDVWDGDAEGLRDYTARERHRLAKTRGPEFAQGVEQLVLSGVAKDFKDGMAKLEESMKNLDQAADRMKRGNPTMNEPDRDR